MNIQDMLTELGDHITGITNDSRKVRDGFVYVAVRGAIHNGDDFIQDALERGAVAIVTELNEPRYDVPSITVPDARLALAELSCSYYRWPAKSLYMVGITGTNGKTTTAYLIYKMFENAGRRPGLMSTVEYRIGDRVIPASRTTMDSPGLNGTLSEMLQCGCESAVMEVSSHAIDQKRVAYVDFDSMVFTNLSRDHLDYHDTMGSYFEAKKRIFIDLPQEVKKTSVIINADDQHGLLLLESEDIKAKKISYGIDANADVMGENLEVVPEGISFNVKTPWGERVVSSSLVGRYNVSNILAAIAVCGDAGISLDVMVAAVAEMGQIPGRLEEIPVQAGGFQVFVDYAHTDDALDKMLTAVKEITRNRLILVFGCGGERDKTKRPAMAKVAGSIADYVFLTSDNPRREDPKEIIDEICSGFDGYSDFEIIEDRRAAIGRSIEMAEDGDVVVVAGKGHESFQEMSRTVVPFDDRQVIAELLGDRQKVI